MNIAANNPALQAWVSVPPNSDFPIQNLPFGIFKTANSPAGVGIRIGDYVVDLVAFNRFDHFEDIYFDKTSLAQPTLNSFIACGKPIWQAVRQRISDFLQGDEVNPLRMAKYEEDGLLIPITQVEMLLPVHIPNYTDFYSSIEHATNVGSMFRPDNPLLPNWKHLPVGYHGRASSIMVSGTSFNRPKGQFKPADSEVPLFGATRQLDFELEMAFIVGKTNELGESVPTDQAEEHIFGFVLFNDWSARDIQAWEYVPLGPFLGKNFFSSVSAWVVTLDALQPFRIEQPSQDTPLLPYLQTEGKQNFDIRLEVAICPPNSTETVVCRSNTKYLYWSVAQQFAHHTVNGCNAQIGDLYASGTISGKEKDSFGSMLELAWRGTKPLPMQDGTERKFIQDDDTVIMRAYAEKDGVRIGFGEVRNLVLAAKE
jgi:fumarylacetoacetase